MKERTNLMENMPIANYKVKYPIKMLKRLTLCSRCFLILSTPLARSPITYTDVVINTYIVGVGGK